MTRWSVIFTTDQKTYLIALSYFKHGLNLKQRCYASKECQ